MYKYSEELRQFENCPAQGCLPKDKVAFRFVHDEELQERSFLPVSIMDPARTFRHGKKICTGYSLSLFETLEAAKQKYDVLKRYPNTSKKIGTKVASGIIRTNLGECSNVNHEGHFDFFEYQGCNLVDVFTYVEDLV